MNRKVKSFTILILGLLVASIYFSALTQGAVLSDQLIVTEGSYVKGKFLYTNSTHNDVLMAYITLSVDDIWNDSYSLLNVVNFKVLYEFESGEENPLGADDMTIMEMTVFCKLEPFNISHLNISAACSGCQDFFKKLIKLTS